MRCRLLVCLLPLAFFGACCTPNQRTEPQYPDHVTGWIDTVDDAAGVRRLGSFVLRKGESVNNGNVKVELVNIIPPDACESDAGVPRYYPRAVIQFVRVKDSAVLLKDRYVERSGNAIDVLDIGALSIYRINVKDGWVHFGLIGYLEK